MRLNSSNGDHLADDGLAGRGGPGGGENPCGAIMGYSNQCHTPAIWEWFIPPMKIYGIKLGMAYDCFTNMSRI